jgi:hypothetical protein
MYTCAVCGEQVSRRKSYCVGDDFLSNGEPVNGARACRVHEEVRFIANELAEERKAAAKKKGRA